MDAERRDDRRPDVQPRLLADRVGCSQITANERFALFVPEKRPFFLEGVDLLSTTIQAVYTRTITDPKWGTRATGKVGNTPTQPS